MPQGNEDPKTFLYHFFTTRPGSEEKSYRRKFVIRAENRDERHAFCEELNQKCQEMLDGKIEDLFIHLYSFGRTLDVGCGSNKRGELGVDPTRGTGVDIVADGRFLPFKGNSFDCVILTHVLEHIGEMRRAVLEAWRVAKSSVLIFVPRRKASFVHPDHIHHLHEEEYKKILEDIFWIEDVFIVGIAVFFICHKLFPVNDFTGARIVSVT